MPWRKKIDGKSAPARPGRDSGQSAIRLERRQLLASTTATIAGLAVGCHGWRWLAERRALAALPAAPPDAPNVLFIVLDTVRAASLSLYGYGRPTSPNLERLAETSVSFARAIAPAAWTLPSHAAMFTGRSLEETKVDWYRALDQRFPTLAEVLSAQGYETAGFVGNRFYCCREFGLHRGFAHYEDYRQTPRQVLRTSSVARRLSRDVRFASLTGDYDYWRDKDAAKLNSNFLRWLDRQHEKRPFFAFLNYMDAHSPYVPLPGFERRFGVRRPRVPWPESGLGNPGETEALRDAYDSCVAGLDHHLGQLLDSLRTRSVLTNTLIIVTSDHGEHFGEHNLMGHGNSLYLPLLHVPLVISFPAGGLSKKQVDRIVSLRSLPATIMDLLGLRGDSPFPCHSLAATCQRSQGGAAALDAPILCETNRDVVRGTGTPADRGAMKSLFQGSYHYILNGDGREEVYDFERNPLEDRDLATVEQGQKLLPSFRSSLQALLAESQP